jgi:hypothetical protein
MSLIAPIAAAIPAKQRAKQDGGRGGIRTHGGFPHSRFRVECLKPDSATLPIEEKRTSNAERPTSNVERKSHLELYIGKGDADNPVCEGKPVLLAE